MSVAIDQRSPPADLRIPWLTVFAIFAASRLVLAIVVLWSVFLDGYPHGLNVELLKDIGCRWDCGWYLTIINQGYSVVDSAAQPGATNWAFFPLYPLLVKALVALTGLDPRAAGMAISNACFLAALGLIYRYTLAVGADRRAALFAVALIAFLPQGAVFSAVYTESLFLLLLVAAMLAMREGNYLVSGVSAALLSAVRTNGVFFIVFAAGWLLQRFGPADLVRPWRAPARYLPILMAPLGAFMFWSYAYTQTGDAFAMATTVKHGWGWSWSFPLGNLWMHVAEGSVEAKSWALGSLFAFVCSLLLLRHRLYAEFVFCASVFTLIWGGSVANSLWRYSMILFPVWIALAMSLRNRPIGFALLLAALGMIGGLLAQAWGLQMKVSI